ncbi:hypothetical protein B7494_g2893 [Chlorociboria aeruginascens]|nr:hypothetical protein B7494_g2893 [Chlorociboria aeruginascens]
MTYLNRTYIRNPTSPPSTSSLRKGTKMSSHIPSLTSTPASQIFNIAKSIVFDKSIVFAPLVTVSRTAVTSLFSRIEKGTLIITDEPAGKIVSYGEVLVKPMNGGINGSERERGSAELVVKKEIFWVRLALFADMGFSESYMLGEVECEDLTSFFELFIHNRTALQNATTLASSLSSTLTSLARHTNTLSNSLLNASAHYDISNSMFAAFLSPDMTYSCPIWSTPSASAPETETLETAQLTKLHRFIYGAKIKASDHVLEIGTGWGSFAIECVRVTGCRITSLTLSIEQKILAESRIAEAGYSKNITVLLKDYRSLPVPKTPYDKIISIEMLEAVGAEYLRTYFHCIHTQLKREGGIAMFQCITIPEARYKGYKNSQDFIRRYIFPGGHLPTVTQLLREIERGAEGALVVERLENIGGHYAKTLRLWKEAFLRNFEIEIKPSLGVKDRGMGDKEIEVFRRKWLYYFTYCEAAFKTKTLGDVILTVGREGAMELMEGVPL